MNSYRHKRRDGAVGSPLPEDMEVGEIAINLFEKKLYSKDENGNVFTMGAMDSEDVELAQLNIMATMGNQILKNTTALEQLNLGVE